MILSLAAVNGCASTPDVPIEQRYTRMNWARTSVQQADAECDAAVGANPLMSHFQCMRGKGWQER